MKSDEAFEEDKPRPRRDAVRRRHTDGDDDETSPHRSGKAERRRDVEEDGDEARPRRRRRPREYDDDDDEGDFSSLIPYKNGKALAAYYCGVFALIPCVGLVLGPVALIFGILGVRFAKEHPKAHGTGHAIAGIILGSLVLVGHIAIIVLFGIGMMASRR